MDRSNALSPSLIPACVVVAVDASPDSVAAALFGQAFARRTGAECHLLHVVRPGEDLAVAGMRVRDTLRSVRPPASIAQLELLIGEAAEQIVRRAESVDAGLIILGGKQHTLLDRWIAGSTALSVVRETQIPVLITRGTLGPIARIIAGVDATPMALAPIRYAEEWATQFGAQLRLVHAFEAPGILTGNDQWADPADLRHDLEAQVLRVLSPMMEQMEAEAVLEMGEPMAVLSEQVGEWNAELVVVARSDHGTLDQFMLGNVTEQLLDGLPASILIVPAQGTQMAPADDPMAVARVA